MADHTVRVYEPHKHNIPPLGPYLDQMRKRMMFAYVKAQADMKAQHLNTWLGQVWTVLNPLLLASVYFLLLGVIFPRPGGADFGFLAFIVGGLFAFTYTRNAINFGANSIVRGGALLMNTALPRAILPFSATVSSTLLYVPMLAVYAVFHVVGGHPVSLALLWLPILVAIQAVMNLGFALGFGALTVYFRDTSSVLPYLLRIWLYLSPVLYRIDDVPARLQPFLYLNPLTPFFAAWHKVLYDATSPSVGDLAGFIAWSLGLVLVSAWFFLTREREFAVRV